MSRTESSITFLFTPRKLAQAITSQLSENILKPTNVLTPFIAGISAKLADGQYINPIEEARRCRNGVKLNFSHGDSITILYELIHRISNPEDYPDFRSKDLFKQFTYLVPYIYQLIESLEPKKPPDVAAHGD